MAKAKKKKTAVKKIKPVKKAKVLVKPKKKKPVQKKKVFKIKPAKKSVKKSAIKPAKKVKTKIKPVKPVPEFPAETFFKARIKVIGIGGGGGSIVSEIGRSLSKATFMVADTDIRALKKKSGIKYMWFGGDMTHGLGTGVDVDLAKRAAETAKEKVSENFKDQDIIIFIASLGGGLGSGATQVFAEAAKNFGGITFGIFTMPFKFEGKIKQRIALNALKSLRLMLNVSLVIPNEKIFKIIDANTPITQAFSTVNKSLIESLESLIDLIYSPGIINIDFADLRSILRGRGNAAFLNTVEESGKDRAEKTCNNILSNPLLQHNSVAVEKILFNIAGADNLSMFEVEKISSHIANLNPKAKIIFGISKSPKLKNKIKTTILMTGGGNGDGIQQESEKEIKKQPVAEKAKPEKKTEESKIVSKPEEKTETENKVKKPTIKIRKEKKKIISEKKVQEKVPNIPIFKAPSPVAIPLEQRKINLIEQETIASKKAIRRSGLEIKKAEEQEEKRKLDQEKEWEIPAFLRRVKYNK